MRALSKSYLVWLCDIWGVVHDGNRPIASAVEALQNHRKNGGKVILITNAPRPKDIIQAFIDDMGVARSAYDDLVTSGDVTRDLMLQHGGQGLYHIGPPCDLSLFEGLSVKRTKMEAAGAVICTGYFDENAPEQGDYAGLLAMMKQLGLTMICANPDKVVRVGDNLIPCAGAIAAIYEGMGGKVLMAGKPYQPIYTMALSLCGNPDKSSVLAIGDGPETDMAGAVAQGLACVFISGGINSGEAAEVRLRENYPRARVLRAMRELCW